MNHINPRDIHIWVSGWAVRKDNKTAGVQGEGNVTPLILHFDESWDDLAKKITFWDAQGQHPVERTLTADLLVDLAHDTRTYRTTVPKEALTLPGDCTFVIDGYMDGKRARSLADTFAVKYAPVADNAGQPTDPTPTQAEQLQKQIDTLLTDLSEQAGIAQTGAQDAKASELAAAGSAAKAQRSQQIAQDAETHTQRLVDEFTTEEAARVVAEKDRREAEVMRSEAEAARINDETTRRDAEEQRGAAEMQRNTAEQVRITTEQARALAESGRIQEERQRTDAEAARQAAEQVRARAETARESEEEVRAKQEDVRDAEEQERITRETTRIETEGNRNQAESIRSGAEQIRQSNEGQRITAESLRAQAEAVRRDEHAALVAWGPYDPSAGYVPGNKVAYRGQSYLCLSACTGVAPEEGPHWRIIAAKGDAGPRGPQGERGMQGPAGAAGEQGPRGETGPQGEQGVQGLTGPAGPQGIQVETGAMGPQGIQGDRGATGPQGPKGEKGDPGQRGDSGITMPVNGFYSLYVNEAGYLMARVPDGAAAPPVALRDGCLILTI